MRITAYCYSNQGGRTHNEDSLHFFLEDQRGVFVLADGLGGHQSGEVASDIAVRHICDGCGAAAPDAMGLAALFQAANTEILKQQAAPGQNGMKTTAVALSIAENHGVWAHVGDSRLYRFSGGEVTQLTRDHSVTYRKYLGGEISYMDVYHDDDRASLLRVLGKASCTPETGEGNILPGDAFLLCSDGFWEFVYNEEMLADWLKAETPAQWAQLMLLRHIQRTPPGTDNFSLIAVFTEDFV